MHTSQWYSHLVSCKSTYNALSSGTYIDLKIVKRKKETSFNLIKYTVLIVIL